MCLPVLLKALMPQLLSLIVCTLAALLAGCASPHRQTVQSASLVTASASNCEFQSAHTSAIGIAMPEGFYCLVSAPHARGAGSLSTSAMSATATAGYVPRGCSVVEAYIRRDMTTVGPYVRCASQLSASNYRALNVAASAAPTAAVAPCVTGSCGPINVKGYYRKDGTYVRPHTRSRRR